MGWTKDEGGSTIWDFTDFTNSLYVPTTFYAVWEHPTEDTWTGNHDSNSHWKECSCGAKANVAVHIEDNGTVTEEPTATKNGVKTYLCRECGYTMRTEVLPATGAPTVSENDPPKPDNPNTPGDSDTPVNPDAPGNSDTPVNPDAPGNSDTPANPTVPGSTNNTPSNPNVSGGNNTSVTTSVSTTASGRKNGEPKTGDVPYVEIYATAAMIAGMAYLLLYFGDDKRGMSEAEKKELVSQLIAWAKKGGCFRRVVALTAIFFLLCYYHSIGKKVRALGFETR